MNCKEARILCNTTIGMVKLVKMIDLPGTREMIESTGAELESIDGVTSVHSLFYRMSSRYYQIIGNHAEYYREALRFLGCTDASELDDAEKLQWAITTTLAALLGEGVYNFGELVSRDALIKCLYLLNCLN
ncbi:unnamed protein product [Protopolystoma xenopodis]|uniref:PSD13 N-terminal domain-containing protein n=1 Tax=Protopolystoma xenopodis TaxID=117903 RepID=A0A3S5AD37_9PLAT|nr:unnamed protein product [Protopolystoma xenopodis]